MPTEAEVVTDPVAKKPRKTTPAEPTEPEASPHGEVDCLLGYVRFTQPLQMIHTRAGIYDAATVDSTVINKSDNFIVKTIRQLASGILLTFSIKDIDPDGTGEIDTVFLPWHGINHTLSVNHKTNRKVQPKALQAGLSPFGVPRS